MINKEIKSITTPKHARRRSMAPVRHLITGTVGKQVKSGDAVKKGDK